jgi:hypothetical protein
MGVGSLAGRSRKSSGWLGWLARTTICGDGRTGRHGTARHGTARHGTNEFVFVFVRAAVDPQNPPSKRGTRDSGATGAPMKKPRPLSLLNMPPISRVGCSVWRKATWIGAGTRFERAAHLERPWQAGRVRVRGVLRSKKRGHFPYSK